MKKIIAILLVVFIFICTVSCGISEQSDIQIIGEKIETVIEKFEKSGCKMYYYSSINDALREGDINGSFNVSVTHLANSISELYGIPYYLGIKKHTVIGEHMSVFFDHIDLFTKDDIVVAYQLTPAKNTNISVYNYIKESNLYDIKNVVTLPTTTENINGILMEKTLFVPLNNYFSRVEDSVFLVNNESYSVQFRVDTDDKDGNEISDVSDMTVWKIYVEKL